MATVLTTRLRTLTPLISAIQQNNDVLDLFTVSDDVLQK
jgi:hypothetical protein